MSAPLSLLSSLLSSGLSLVQGKGLFLAGAAALTFLAATGVQSCRLDSAREDLEAARQELARTKNLWLIDRQSAGSAIAGLQRQLAGTLADFAAFRAEEASRLDLARRAQARPRTTEEQSQVVDDATRKRAVDFLNAW
jgi:hypothetical protein